LSFDKRKYTGWKASNLVQTLMPKNQSLVRAMH